MNLWKNCTLATLCMYWVAFMGQEIIGSFFFPPCAWMEHGEAASSFGGCRNISEIGNINCTGKPILISRSYPGITTWMMLISTKRKHSEQYFHLYIYFKIYCGLLWEIIFLISSSSSFPFTRSDGHYKRYFLIPDVLHFLQLKLKSSPSSKISVGDGYAIVKNFLQLLWFETNNSEGFEQIASIF